MDGEKMILRPANSSEQSVSPFLGFKAPTSNTTYTPNQFFDVVIPNFSRGVVRIVAYLIRKTLGWCDANGNPQETQIEVTYSELEKKAGVSRDMIRPALDAALSSHLIECVAVGRPKLAHDAGQSSCYQLCWSSLPYTTRSEEFRGFFEGEGNRTDIPNEFFDVIVPQEPLSVIKVVGSVIRHSIGFQTKHGRRRQQVALSYHQIENYARFGSRADLAKAVRTAIEKNYILRMETGVFSYEASERRRAVYAIRWFDNLISQKNELAPERSEKQTSISQISEPVDQSEKRTNIKTKLGNETGNSHAAADSDLHLKLVATGFSGKTATKLMREHSRQDIEEQMAWLPGRSPARSPAGLLLRAIEQRWPAPIKLRAPEVSGTAGWEFARCFYAAYGGNHGEPVNDPSPREAQIAEVFVQRLSKARPGESTPGEWGRFLGQLAREQRNPFPSLTLAIRQLGDAYLMQIEKQRLHEQLSSITERRQQHEEMHREAWLHWLAEQEAETRLTSPGEYARFTAKREEDRAELKADPKPWSRRVLEHFDTDSARLNAFREFSGLPGFWRWDAEFNSQSFNPTS
ncbi:hypothetical protein BGE01nite_37510 [Brevifollis gellanilyticus]|uniref:Bacteriophage lambda Replication protein O N-terminal domain-containing protein n=2 Tax=Brevifollis gellanilyticus TaxID=748831 RepID=A0A512MCJ2_9BACT|nr:hypothetical protein BGE01nite_37510 [Brevifollis gellanilyticus]